MNNTGIHPTAQVKYLSIIFNSSFSLSQLMLSSIRHSFSVSPVPAHFPLSPLPLAWLWSSAYLWFYCRCPLVSLKLPVVCTLHIGSLVLWCIWTYLDSQTASQQCNAEYTVSTQSKSFQVCSCAALILFNSVSLKISTVSFYQVQLWNTQI